MPTPVKGAKWVATSTGAFRLLSAANPDDPELEKLAAALRAKRIRAGHRKLRTIRRQQEGARRVQDWLGSVTK